MARRNSLSGSANDQETEPGPSCQRGRKRSGSSNGGKQDHSLSGSWDDCDFDQEERKEQSNLPSAPPGRAHGNIDPELDGPSSDLVDLEADLEADLDWDAEADCTTPAPYSRAPYFSLMRQAEELGAFTPATGSQTQGDEKAVGRSNPVGSFLADAELRRTVRQTNLASSIPVPNHTTSVRRNPSVYPFASSSKSWDQYPVETAPLGNAPFASEGPTQPLLRRVKSGFSITSKASTGSWEHLNQIARISTDNVVASPLSGSWTPIGEKRPGTPWEFVERVKRRRGSIGERVVKFEPCNLEEEVGMGSSSEATFFSGDDRVA